MTKQLTTVLLLFLCTALRSQADVLTIYTWADYIDQQVVAEFEETYGHEIRQTYFDLEKYRDRNFARPGQADYDLVLLDEYSTKMFGRSGFLQDITELEIFGLENHAQEFRKSCSNWGVPYGWNTLGIAYRESFVSEKIESWQSFFNPPAGIENKIILPMDEMETPAAALMSAGYAFDSNGIEELNAAYSVLEGQLSYLLSFGNAHTHASIKQENSDMRMTMTNSRDLKWLGEFTGQQDWVFVIPKEGGISRHDCWVIPASKTMKHAALDFLSYINRPEIAAKNAEGAGFSTTNSVASAFLSEAYLSNPVLNPPEETLSRINHFDNPSADMVSQRNWLAFLLRMEFDQRIKRQH